MFTEERIILNMLALSRISCVKRIYKVSLIPETCVCALISLNETFTVLPSAGISAETFTGDITVAV